MIVRKLGGLAYARVDQSDWLLRSARGFEAIFELVIEFQAILALHAGRRYI